MAQAIIWSNEALDDIHSIAEYIERDSPFYAEQVVERLFDLAEELHDVAVRERFVYSYP